MEENPTFLRERSKRERAKRKRIEALERERNRAMVIDSVCPFRNVMFYRCGFFQFDTKWRRLLDAGVDQYSTRNEHHINSERWTSVPPIRSPCTCSRVRVYVCAEMPFVPLHPPCSSDKGLRHVQKRTHTYTRRGIHVRRTG